MTGPAWSQAALDYLAKHAIDPEVAAGAGVTERDGELVYPYGGGRRRPLTGSAKVIGASGVPLSPWWLTGRPTPGAPVLVCEGESDALAALSALHGLDGLDGRPAEILASLGVVAIPGASMPADRLASALRAAAVGLVYLAFDGDAAGRKATERIARALAAVGLECRVVGVPEGRDLAETLAATDPAKRGGALAGLLDLAEPWRPAAVDGAATGAPVVEVAQFIRRYVVVTDAQLAAVALWIAHTHAIGAAHATPYLVAHSAEKRSGKTRLLEVLELLVRDPWRVSSTSEAAMFRKLAQGPTLLLDEIDAIFGTYSERTEPLRAILNAGNRPGSAVARCVGPQQEVRDFDVFGAKVLAGIDTGRLPDTIRDRAVIVEMARKTGDESVQRFRHRDAHADAQPIRAALAAWAKGNTDALRDAQPEEPAGLDDRAAEAWEPLLAIADQAGGDWPVKAREAAAVLSGQEREDESHGVRLLAAIRGALEGKSAIASSELVAVINDDDELPFGGWRDGKGLDARTLARKLKPYGIGPHTVRLGEDTAKGYRAEQFEDAFKRYLVAEPPAAPIYPSQRNKPDTYRANGDFRIRHTPPDVTDEKPSNLALQRGLSRCDGYERAVRDGEHNQPSEITAAVAYLHGAVKHGLLTDAEGSYRLDLLETLGPEAALPATIRLHP